jgi:hypothetical protein
METAMTSILTGALLSAPTGAGGGSTGTNASLSWALLEAPAQSRAGSGSTLMKPLSGTRPERTAQDFFWTFLPAFALPSGAVIPSRPRSWTRLEATAHEFASLFLSTLTLTSSSFTGTNERKLFETARDLRRIYWASPNIVAEHTASECIFDAIQALYLSHNNLRDRQIAERLTALYRDALEEDEIIRPASITQFKDFFLAHPDLGFPKITLTPDGTLRARWIQGKGNFVAIEFTGDPNAKLVAEIPRANSLTATHFASEPLENIVAVAQAMGASFA